MNNSQSPSATKAKLNVQPLKALRYNTGKLDMSKVVAPPYDVIKGEKQQKLYDLSPYNCVRLILNQKEAGDNDQNNIYTRAKDFFVKWQKEEILVREKEPGFYVYKQTFTDPATGETKNRSALLARVKTEPFEKGLIIPHEKTLKGPRADRMNLIRSVEAGLSPVFGLYQDPGDEVGTVIQSQTTGKALFEVKDEDGILHALYLISDKTTITQLHELMPDSGL